MTSSAYGTQYYEVRGIALSAGEPLDALHFRDALSSASHLADQASQVRVAWTDADGIGKDDANLGRYPDWVCVWRSGPWFARVGPEGVYRYRVRLAGRRVGASGTARWRLIIGSYPADFGEIGYEPTSASTTTAWLTDAAGTTVIEPATRFSHWPTREAIGGPTTGLQCALMGASVWIRVRTGDADGLLHGVYIAEVY